MSGLTFVADVDADGYLEIEVDEDAHGASSNTISHEVKTGTHVFSGYLSRTQANGLVSGNVDLSKPITCVQISQLAAKAMKPSTYNLSSAKPFTDTTAPYVQVLNAAGIVEGYFSGSTSTCKPNKALTRGQVSAIVWQMRNYNK